MPATRKKITRSIRGEISRFAVRMASNDLFYPKAEAISMEDYDLTYPTLFPEVCGQLWEQHGQAIIEAWAKKHPGTRPAWWWLFPGPRFRQRLGGQGSPKFEHLADVPAFGHGIPENWITPEDVRTWPDLAGKEINPADPPVFESEATFLKLNGLLLPGEDDRIKRRAWQPEKVHLEE